MAKWARWTLLLAVAVVCFTAGMIAPAGWFAPGLAVLAFLLISRSFGVASFSATVVFALAIVAAPIVFLLVTASSSETYWYEAVTAIASMFGLPDLMLFFCLPIVVVLASYLARRWVYTPNSAVNTDAPSARRLP